MNRIRASLTHWTGSLIFRFTLVSLSAITLLGALSSILLSQNVQATLITALQNNGENLASQLAVSAADLLAENNTQAVRRLLSQVKYYPGLQDISIVDGQSEIVAGEIPYSSGVTNLYDYLNSPLPMTDVRTVMITGSQKILRDANIYTIITPLFDPQKQDNQSGYVIGAVIVRMNLSSIIVEKNAELTQRGWYNVLLILFVAAFIIPLVYFSVVRPLNRITQATQKIASGSFETRLPLAGAQEISALAAAFNRMVDDLQTSRDETQKHMDELQVLNEISAATGNTLAPEKVLDYLSKELAHLVQGSGALIVINNESHLAEYISAYGSFHEIDGSCCFDEDGNDLIAEIFDTGKSAVATTSLASSLIHPGSAAQFPVMSILGLPLVSGSLVIGAALIGDTNLERRFSYHEIEIATSAVRLIAAAVSNAQLFEELAAGRNRLNEILNAVSDAVIVTDLDSRILYINQAFASVTGADPATATQHSPWDLLAVPPEQLPAILHEVHQVALNGDTWPRELTGIHPDGSTYDADVVIAGISDKDAQLVGYVASVRNITHLKELDRMKTRFVSTVSHELRTPLSVINLYTENLMEFYEQLDDTRRRQILTDIHHETEILHQLIEDLLGLSRLDSGRAEPRRTVFNLCQLLIESISMAKVLAGEKEIELTFQLPECRVPVFADRDQLAQVFRNLLSNAVKFTPPQGRVWLDFNFEGDQIVVQICDTGIGIPTADMPRLFERFFRSELSIQQEVPGTGLGLAISREIIQRHNGAIEVYSEVGKGSTFRVLLPMAETHRPEIFLIGGDAALYSNLSRELAAEYLLTNFTQFENAWSQLPPCPPVMFIVTMPCPDNVACDFIRSLRVEPRFSLLPILAFSDGQPELVVDAYQAGADEFISDSSGSLDTLISTIRRLLANELMQAEN
ncbi:MAG: ATP-binding protein [Anaerolineaceae bacterium]|nr:ATP-binding protein [Anaerolineaceae bacterium]